MIELEKLIHRFTNELRARNLTIATAESCTGGLLASFLTELPGSSAWFERGFVTYSNAAKQEMLGVEPGLIMQHGAVSDVVAKAMARGALQCSAASVSVSITGVAGPGGGSPQKPVGTVCLAFAARKGGVQCERHYFADASRQQIRMLACRHAFLGMIRFLPNELC